MKTFGEFVYVMLIVALFTMVLMYGPYINIWCYNTLFKLGIEYNWSTWLAMLWFNVTVLGVFHSRSMKS